MQPLGAPAGPIFRPVPCKERGCSNTVAFFMWEFLENVFFFRKETCCFQGGPRPNNQCALGTWRATASHVEKNAFTCFRRVRSSPANRCLRFESLMLRG